MTTTNSEPGHAVRLVDGSETMRRVLRCIDASPILRKRYAANVRDHEGKGRTRSDAQRIAAEEMIEAAREGARDSMPLSLPLWRAYENAQAGRADEYADAAVPAVDPVELNAQVAQDFGDWRAELNDPRYVSTIDTRPGRPVSVDVDPETGAGTVKL